MDPTILRRANDNGSLSDDGGKTETQNHLIVRQPDRSNGQTAGMPRLLTSKPGASPACPPGAERAAPGIKIEKLIKFIDNEAFLAQSSMLRFGRKRFHGHYP
jgi:hypothetical protein